MAHANRVKCTVTGAPGTGTVTIGSAVARHQSFASAYGANTTCDVLFIDGADWELAIDCAYDHGAGTIGRGTLEDSSTGGRIALTSSAQVAVTILASRGNAWDAHAASTSNPHSVSAAQAGADPAGTANTAVSSHVAAADPHTQYPLLAGRLGGQTLIGGTESGNNLTLQSTSHATKGNVILGSTSGVVFDGVNNRLGIGTASPGARLVVVNGGEIINDTSFGNTTARPAVSGGGTPGNYEIRGVGSGSAGDHGFLRLRAGGNTSAPSATYIDLSGYNAIADVNKNIVFGTAGAERLRIDSSGNVGIGTTAPAQKLDITGGSVRLDDTTTSTSGVIYKGSTAFMHNFHHPTGSTAVPDGQNTFVGENAGNFTMGSTATQTSHGSYNTAIGRNALQANTTGYNSTAIGRGALSSNTTGHSNTASGMASIFTNTTGYQNSALGLSAGRYIADGATGNTTANNSLFLGYDTRALADGQTNQVVIGASAIGNGSNTVTIGNSSITANYFQGILDTAGNKLRIRTAKTPSSASDTGNTGDVCWDADYLYVCIATNTWKRTALSTW